MSPIVRRAFTVLVATLGFALGATGCVDSAGARAAQRRGHRGHFASPIDTLRGDGSAERPWSLAVALSKIGAVSPGDTLWLDAGVYPGVFTSRLEGTAAKPVVIRGLPGARATIDGPLTVRGAFAEYRDFEVTNSARTRSTATPGSDPADYKRRAGIDVHGAHTRFINLVVHDAGGGFGLWSQAIGAEVYGCLVFYNGWQGPDRGHGHGIYAQNRDGVMRIADNVVFAQFGNGINIYGSSQAFLAGFDVDGNFAFENGILAAAQPGIDLFVGGGVPASRIRVRDNATYRTDGLLTARFGYDQTVTNEDLLLDGNTLAGGTNLSNWRRVVATRNVFTGAQNLVEVRTRDSGRVEAYGWDANVYAPDRRREALNSTMPLVVVEADSGRGFEFSDWRRVMGHDSAGRSLDAPAGVRIVVRPNRYERGRANIAVYNWAHRRTVPVDLSRVLEHGDEFEIVAAYDYFGKPVARGTYDGTPVQLTLRGLSIAAPVGLPRPKRSGNDGEFGVFVVRKTRPGTAR